MTSHHGAAVLGGPVGALLAGFDGSIAEATPFTPMGALRGGSEPMGALPAGFAPRLT